jgi:hypothetical protein
VPREGVERTRGDRSVCQSQRQLAIAIFPSQRQLSRPTYRRAVLQMTDRITLIQVWAGEVLYNRYERYCFICNATRVSEIIKQQSLINMRPPSTKRTRALHRRGR